MEENKTPPGVRRRAGHGKPGLPGCLVTLAVLVALAGLGWYILLGQAAAPQASSYTIDLRKIRQMSQEQPGKLPLRLNAAVVGEGSYPQVIVMAGAGLQPQKMIFAAYQLVYEDRTVMIDSTFPEADYNQMSPGGAFDSHQYDNLQRALLESSLVLLTHTHVDHVAGITHSPDASSLIPRVLFTQEQIANPSSITGMTAELLAQVRSIDYEALYTPAPGVVLVKAPGHSPGDQMIYVHLQDGSEFLLVGDVAWSTANISRATGRPLLLRWLMREDWQMSGSEIRALHDLMENEPLHLVVSHDGPRLEDYIAQGVIGDGFE